MSEFDLFAFNDVEAEEILERLDDWLDGLVAAFRASPEAQPGSEDAGTFARLFADYAFRGIGTPLRMVRVADAAELMLEVFPRKVVLETPDEASEALAEITSLWRWLDREWKLEQAASIVALLERLDSQFQEAMFDESQWGPAKAFVLSGVRDGYDMRDAEQFERYMSVYSTAAAMSVVQQRFRDREKEKKEKRKRKMEKLSRKKNRRK